MADQKKVAAAAQDDPNKVWQLADLVARGRGLYGQLRGVPSSDRQGHAAGVSTAGRLSATGPKEAHISTVLNGVVKDGKPTAMVAWKNSLSDTDIAAVVTFERNTWSNHTGDAINHHKSRR